MCAFYYLECGDSNIANIGAIFRGKSAMENTGCACCKMVEAEAELRLFEVRLVRGEPLYLAGEILK